MLRVRSSMPVRTGMAKAVDDARRTASVKKRVGRFMYLYPSFLRLSTFRGLPAAEERVLDVKLVEDFPDGLIDEVIHGRRAVIEGRHRRQNDCAHLRGADHVAQVAQMK